ncbi:MAG: dihydrolipoamide acyltransferase [Salinivirgaceae bacterium]|nr:MAG: dihydrolipoamide acyltransferase [Salinivirgaceae bacterium]
MNLNIPINHTYEIDLIVEKKHTALAYGSGLAEVFATPAMVAFMENAAYKSIEPFLPEGHSTVGMEINVKHLKATLPGKKLVAKSKVTAVDGRKISFEIKVYEGEHLAGNCTHDRFLINNEKFIAKLNQQT